MTHITIASVSRTDITVCGWVGSGIGIIGDGKQQSRRILVIKTILIHIRFESSWFLWSFLYVDVGDFNSRSFLPLSSFAKKLREGGSNEYDETVCVSVCIYKYT